MHAERLVKRLPLAFLCLLIAGLALLGATMMGAASPAYAQTKDMQAASIDIGQKFQLQSAKELYTAKKPKVTAAKNYDGTTLPKGKATIKNVKSVATIEADVKVAGKGAGRHAKLVIVTPFAGVSFGVQWDKDVPRENQRNRAMLMVENIRSNDPGGQSYYWVKYKKKNIEIPEGEYAHLMIAVKKNGSFAVYVNGNKVGSYKNPNLKNQTLSLRVEGAAKKNGNSVKAWFKNIKLKNNGTYNPSRYWGTHEFESCKTITATKKSSKAVTIKGKITGWPKNVDWDSPYYAGVASGIIQFT